MEPRPDIASVVILAAGQGKRMKSDLPKVLHSVCGLPMISHVLAAASYVAAARTVVVLGHGHEQVLPLLPSGVEIALQAQQLGTGHALLSASDRIPAGATLVLPGDTPLITGEALDALARAHRESGADATVLTMVLDDPTGYGRVVRDQDGRVLKIVEHRDATAEELAICEVNAGMYVLPAPQTFQLLRHAGMDNDQGELYLTDVVESLRVSGARVEASLIADPRLVLGVNSRVELADAERILGERIKQDWMLAGVTIVDPRFHHHRVHRDARSRRSDPSLHIAARRDLGRGWKRNRSLLDLDRHSGGEGLQASARGGGVCCSARWRDPRAAHSAHRHQKRRAGRRHR